MAMLLWLALAVPAAFAVLVRLAPRAAGAPLTIVGAALSAALAVALLVAAATGSRAVSGGAWLEAAPGLDVGLRLDALSAAMAATVALVALAVLVHATGYFAAERRSRSALAGLLAFVAAMQGLVLADGYLTLLIFWELVGALSARLIAFSRHDPAAPGGAVRAFLTTRTADIGFYVALLALYAGAGTLAFGAERPDGALGALVGVGLVVAAMGKSAQAPLQTWLMGAMAGPTPVSALLHSATMVAAGVYLLIRSDALLSGWPLEVAGWVGALTAVAGAAIALAQSDLKRVLAGSTTSQLGLMFVGAAAGGPAVALFHLIAHAAGKAAMFLAAGAFQQRRGTTELAGLRGVAHEDRAVFACFALGALSIAGVPPLAAFFSKDHVIAAAEHDVGWLVLALLAAAGSAAYLLRPALVLWGPGTGEHAPAPPGLRAMLAGAGALAGASLLLGVAGEPLRDLLGAPPLPASALSIVLSAVALGVGVLVVLRPPATSARLADSGDRRGADSVVDALPLATRRLAAVIDRADVHVVDAAVDGIGRGGLRAAAAEERLERSGIDAAVDGLARAIGRGGVRSRALQSGHLWEYLRDTVLGAAAISAVIVLAAVL